MEKGKGLRATLGFKEEGWGEGVKGGVPQKVRGAVTRPIRDQWGSEKEKLGD